MSITRNANHELNTEKPVSVEASILKEVLGEEPRKLTEKKRPESILKDDNLTKLQSELNEIKRKRYPYPIYEQKEYEIETENGKRMSVLSVQYKQDPQSQLEPKLLDEIQQAAIIERKINLLAGVINAIKLSEDYFNLNDQQKNNLENKLMKFLANEKQKKSDPKKDPKDIIDDFVKHMAGIIATETQLNNADIIRKIRNAERYFVAKSNANKILIFQNNYNDTNYYQVDVPLNYKYELTDTQKLDFVSIHGDKKPKWFTTLPGWEQDCLRDLIPKSIDGNWDFAQFSSMQHMPGLKNNRENYLFSSQNGNLTILSNSIKTSSIVPYEMMKAETTADDTAEQLLSVLEKKAKENFNKQWGSVLEDTKTKPLVLAASLVSDVQFFGGRDIRLSDAQKNSFGYQLLLNDKFNDIEIISGNDPVNFLRGAAYQNKERWTYANQVMNYAERFLSSIKGKELTSEQGKSKQMIKNALEELNLLKDKTHLKRYELIAKGRNFEAFKVAYLAILVEEMGGSVSTNCKSGKDRTGLDELYRHAMRIYFEKNNKLPSFFDNKVERQEFVNIYSQLFNTMKIQEAAAMNTPGSFGIKDGAMMLDLDTQRNLGQSYQYSNKNADMNKPKLFEDDEKIANDELRRIEKKDKKDEIKENAPKPNLKKLIRDNRDNLIGNLSEVYSLMSKGYNEFRQFVKDLVQSADSTLQKKEETNKSKLNVNRESGPDKKEKIKSESSFEKEFEKLKEQLMQVIEENNKIGKYFNDTDGFVNDLTAITIKMEKLQKEREQIQTQKQNQEPRLRFFPKKEPDRVLASESPTIKRRR